MSYGRSGQRPDWNRIIPVICFCLSGPHSPQPPHHHAVREARPVLGENRGSWFSKHRQRSVETHADLKGISTAGPRVFGTRKRVRGRIHETSDDGTCGRVRSRSETIGTRNHLRACGQKAQAATEHLRSSIGVLAERVHLGVDPWATIGTTALKREGYSISQASGISSIEFEGSVVSKERSRLVA